MTIQDAIRQGQKLDGLVSVTRQSWNGQLQLDVVNDYLCMEVSGGFDYCTAPLSVDDLLADDWLSAS